MGNYPHIIATAAAEPPYRYPQAAVLDHFCALMFGPDWDTRPQDAEQARQLARLFTASRVQQRQTVVDLRDYYSQRHSTGERMAEYQRRAHPLARTALDCCLGRASPYNAGMITDFFVVSCTGYNAPGLDILLAHDLDMPCDVRRVIIGHMGCFGALVGLRQSLAVLRAYSDALVALLSVELSSLHWMRTLDPQVLTAAALFGDAAAAVLLSSDSHAPGPELVDAYCATAPGTVGQMSWTVTDEGFVMGLSPRVPVSLRQNVGPVVERLLAPHRLTARDVTHWLVHPGGPSILEAIQGKLALSEEQMALSWQVLREHGNCSSATVLIMLDQLLRAAHTRPGEWGVMMAFGPGLTLETCLLRF